MTKHFSFSMISESKAGSSKKSKSRYDCLPGNRVATQTSNFRRGMFERQRGGEAKEGGGRERDVGHLETSASPYFYKP